MATIFLLGPSFLQSGEKTLLQIRRDLAAMFNSAGHTAFLMEDEPDKPGEDVVDKFYQLIIEKNVTDIVVYWPPEAKMATTHDELVLLRARMDVLVTRKIWVLHHASAATIKEGEFKVLESGNRSRYLEAVARLGVRPLPWSTEAELLKLTHQLALEF